MSTTTETGKEEAAFAELAGTSRSTIYNHIDDLLELGFVEKPGWSAAARSTS